MVPSLFLEQVKIPRPLGPEPSHFTSRPRDNLQGVFRGPHLCPSPCMHKGTQACMASLSVDTGLARVVSPTALPMMSPKAPGGRLLDSLPTDKPVASPRVSGSTGTDGYPVLRLPGQHEKWGQNKGARAQERKGSNGWKSRPGLGGLGEWDWEGDRLWAGDRYPQDSDRVSTDPSVH